MSDKKPDLGDMFFGKQGERRSEAVMEAERERAKLELPPSDGEGEDDEEEET